MSPMSDLSLQPSETQDIINCKENWAKLVNVDTVAQKLKNSKECSSKVLVALIFLVQRNIFEHQYCSILSVPPKLTGYFYCTNDHQFQLF